MSADAYQRMLDWCRLTGTVVGDYLPATVIEGTRTITHQPTGKPGERERGTIDADGFREQDWLGDNVGQVIDLMNDSLGAVDDEKYVIVE